MIAIIFAKKSRRLENKHSMELCGEPMIDLISRKLLESGHFEKIILFTKDNSLKSKYAIIEPDNTAGILIDSIIHCLEEYGEFLAVGGDMPYIDQETIAGIINSYNGESIAYTSGGYCQPLFSIYSIDLYRALVKYRMKGGESISRFLNGSGVKLIEGNQEKLKSINTIKDLMEARKNLGCN